MSEAREAKIGLEIHAQLATRTKLFCRSKNDPDEKCPNVNICPICLGHPGVLPALNHRAVWQVARVGVALGGAITSFTEFDRKNYFYPDIPKGYQISQYQYPIVVGGKLQEVRIRRVHLEEDTARMIHDQNAGCSLVDFNRAGMPLLELVTEPDLKDGSGSAKFARELRLLFLVLGVSNANLEKGEMRVEANVSVAGGEKVEIKNLNSFRSVERAVNYEIIRQRQTLAASKPVLQETRGWDDATGRSFSQRKKESSHDYRYFPEPDLPKYNLADLSEFRTIAAGLPELPWQKRSRFSRTFGLKDEDIEILIENPSLETLFEAAVAEIPDRKFASRAVNYITNDVASLMKTFPPETIVDNLSDGFGKIMKQLHQGRLSSRAAKDLLIRLAKEGGDVEAIIKKESLTQRSDAGELAMVVETVIREHPAVANDYRQGREPALQFLVGQAMKATKGAANPEVLKQLFVETLRP